MAEKRPRKFLVIGLGELGRALATTLADSGAEVIAMDRDMAPVDALKDQVTYAVQADAQDVLALRAVEAHHVDAAIVTMGDDFDAAVMTVTALCEVGIPQIVARAANDRQQRVLERLGATRVLCMEAETGRRLARSLLTPHLLDLQQLAPGYDVAHWPVSATAAGKTLAQLDMRKRYGLQVVAIERADGVQVPEPDAVLQPSDVLIVAGRREHLERLSNL